MKRNLRNKTVGFLCASALACAGIGFMVASSAPQEPVKGAEKVFYQSSLYNWRLVGTPYTIENYSSAVRVFDPNGNPVEATENGKITLTVVGEYTIVYPSSVERLYSLLSKPTSDMQVSAELEESYPAGTILELPAFTVENEAYDFAYYYVDVTLGSTLMETLKVTEGESTVYLLEKDGEYEFKYYVLNDRGEKEGVTLNTVAEKEKTIFADELPSSIEVGGKVLIGNPYGFYDGSVYNVSVSVKSGNDETKISGQSFTFETAGEYTFVFAATIGGEKVTLEQTVTAYAPEETLFRVTNGEGTEEGIQTLPSWNKNSNYTEGLLLKGSTQNVTFNYTTIVDLSSLTKEDNLLVALPYSNSDEGAYMEGLRVVLTDVHDSSRKISLYLWSSEKDAGTNMPNSFATVEIGSNRYGLDSQNARGTLRANTGTVAWGVSFMGAQNNKSDTYTVQYDYLSEILYLMAERNATSFPMQQYVYLPLSGKGEMPQGHQRLPESNWFAGFTTGEVYMSVELVSNKNAGVYLCEIAGKKASEWEADFDKNFLVFDDQIKELPVGSVDYEYTLPTAHLNETIDGNSTISATVKDCDGNDVALTNGKFMPKKAGTYTVCYQTNYYGTILERVYDLTVGEEPVDINISVDVNEVAFGGYMEIPEISLTGGIGKTEYSYKVMLGNADLIAGRDGKYLINREGELKIVVTAKDSTGYEKTQEFKVEIQDGVYFALAQKMPSAIRKGAETAIPSATATSFVNGAYASATVTLKAYENGVEKALTDGKFTASSAATEVRFEYSYADGGETVTKEFSVEVLPEEVASVTEYLLTSGNVTKGITEKGILLTVTGNATANMPHPVAAESLLITIGFHKDSASVDGWEIVLRDTEMSSMLLRLKFDKFNAEAGTVAVSLNGSEPKSWTGRSNTYTESCGDEATAAKYAGKQYVLFSFLLSSEKATINDYETSKTLFDLTAFENGAPFIGFAGNVCMVETSITKTSEGESDLLLAQVGNQYFNYGEDSFGYYESDGIAPSILINGDKTSKEVEYGYTLTVPSASAYDVLNGMQSVKVRIVADGAVVLAPRDANEAFTFVLNEYKAYAIIYEASDVSGNKATAQFNLTVIDAEKPTLSVNGSYQAKVKIGEKVKIQSFTATDAQGDVETVVFVKDNQAKITFVKAGEEYTFEKNGTYEIVYRSVDEGGNIVRKAFTIVVE